MRIILQIESWNVSDGVTLSTREMIATLLTMFGAVRILVMTWMHPGGDAQMTPSVFLNALPAAARRRCAFRLVPSVDYAQLLSMRDSLGLYTRTAGVLPYNARRAVIKFAPDLVHCMSPFGGTFRYLRAYANLHRVPLVVSCRSDFEAYAEARLPRALKQLGAALARCHLSTNYLTAQAIVCLNTRYARNLARELPSFFKSNRLYVFPNGVDVSLFAPDASCAHERPTVVWVSRLVHGKRPDIFVHVAAMCAREFGARVDVYGDGADAADVRALAAREGATTVFHGMVPKREVAAALGAATLLIFPSPVETFGNVTIEALASGCGALVHAQPGAELLSPMGEDAMVRALDSTSVHDWLTAARGMLQAWSALAPERRRELAAARAARARDVYDTRIVYPRYMALYKQLIAT